MYSALYAACICLILGTSYVSAFLPCDSDDRGCRRSVNAEVCSGRGECICGECFCNKRRPSLMSFLRFSGRFCECDDYSCDYYQGKICGGIRRGRCICGECMCKSGWTGPACGCSESVDTCMASNGEICNGQGKCICGQCVCDKRSYYRGPTCEECPTCVGPRRN